MTWQIAFQLAVSGLSVGSIYALVALALVIPFKASKNHPLTEEQRAYNRVVARYRIVVEHALAQLSRFTVLRQVFRGRHGRHRVAHSQVVRVVAGLVNRRTRACPLKAYTPAA